MSELTFQNLEKEIITCRKCQRLVNWREEVGAVKRKAFRDQTYWAKGVPGFGDPKAKVIVVGLAPGAHGSNRTGRMFTGDDSGNFLYPALYRAGFASQPHVSDISDGLRLHGMWITAVCRCVPPDNKPTREEILNCRPFLNAEINLANHCQGIVALGKIAWDEVTGGYAEVPAFGHGVFCPSQNGASWVLASYHPSRQNTQTGRLTAGMFDEIWVKVNGLLTE